MNNVSLSRSTEAFERLVSTELQRRETASKSATPAPSIPANRDDARYTPRIEPQEYYTEEQASCVSAALFALTVLPS